MGRERTSRERTSRGRTSRGRVATAVGAIVVIAAIAVLGGCGTEVAERASAAAVAPVPDSVRDSVAETTVVPVPPTTETIVDVSPEAAIDLAVGNFWSVYLLAHDPPNPDHPALTDVAVGEELDLLRETITGRRSVGESIRRSEGNAFTSTIAIRTLTAGTALVDACVFDDVVVVDTVSNRVVNDEVGTYRFELSMVNLGGHWKVASNRVASYRMGVDTCER